MELAVTSVWA